MTVEQFAEMLISQAYWSTGKEGAACRICGEITGAGFGHKAGCVVKLAQDIASKP